MLSLLLEDNGSRYIISNTINGASKKIREPFDFNFINKEFKRISILKEKETQSIVINKSKTKKDIISKKIKKKIFRLYPFSAEVIYTFNHLNNAEIARWTQLKIYGDSTLKKYIHPHGTLLLISPWALIADNPSSTTLNAWKKFGNDKNIKYEDLKITLQFYLNNWKEAKAIYKSNKANRLKWDPSYGDFLNKRQIDILLKADQALRKSMGLIPLKDKSPKFKKGLNENNTERIDFFDNLQYDDKGSDLPDELDYFLAKFIKKQNRLNMQIRLEEDMKTWKKYPERKKAWILLSKVDIESTYMRSEIKEELNNIAWQCVGKDGERRQLSWLTKRFSYDKNLFNVFMSLKDLLVKSTYSKNFIKEYNIKNQDNQINELIVEKIKKVIIMDEIKTDGDKKIYKYIFDDPQKLKQLTINFQNYLNPKKGRKREFIILVKNILKENGVIK